MESNHNLLFTPLKQTIANLDIDLIPNERRLILDSLIDYVYQKQVNSAFIRLNFICTHNSRRSHLAQIWARTMAFSFGITGIACYSAGTEATEMYPVIGSTLRKSGFEIEKLSDGNNPVYMVKYSQNEEPIIAFSKALDHPFNPQNAFGAVMVCSDADQACPNISGADARFALAYDDPKAYDHSPIQNEKYLERSIQIAIEFYYVFSEVKRKHQE